MFKILRRMIATLALSLSVFGAVQIATPAPASAASYVTGCFKHAPSGAAFTYTVNLDYWANGRWNRTASQTAGVSGCVAWNISGSLRNYPLQMSVAWNVGRAYFYGTSPYYAPAGTARYSLGTGWVYQSGSNRTAPTSLEDARPAVR
jgi:hypothetical protein